MTKDEKEKTITYSLDKLKLNPCPQGEAAFDSGKTDYGGFGNTTAFYDNIEATWSGNKAKVTGALNYIKKDDGSFNKLHQDGNYFAFALKPWFKQKSITVEGKGLSQTTSDTDWVIRITDERKQQDIVVKQEDNVIAKFDLSDVTLKQESEAIALSLDGQPDPLDIKSNDRDSEDFYSFM